MKRFSLAILVMLVAALPVLAQSSKGGLPSLIETGNRKAALERIRAGADVNEAQPDGTRPIHWAVYRLDYELLGALIARKPNLNVRNEFGSTPIAQAAELADARMVKMLLDAGAEPEGANPDGQTALMLAIRTGGALTTAPTLGAGMTFRRTFGFTGFCGALMARLLLQAGAQPLSATEPWHSALPMILMPNTLARR